MSHMCKLLAHSLCSCDTAQLGQRQQPRCDEHLQMKPAVQPACRLRSLRSSRTTHLSGLPPATLFKVLSYTALKKGLRCCLFFSSLGAWEGRDLGEEGGQRAGARGRAEVLAGRCGISHSLDSVLSV